MNLGERMQNLRKQKKYSIRRLAKEVDLSPSFVSQIECGKALPSLDNLKKFSKSLNTSLTYLIEGTEQRISFVKKNQQLITDTLDLNTQISLLTNLDILKSITPLIYEVKPNGESFKGNSQSNTENFIYILEGSVEFTLNGVHYNLSEGDTLYLKLLHTYKFINTTNKITKFLWVKI